MRFLLKKAPDNFIKSVNDEISSILNRHFDNYYPDYGYEEDMDKLSMPVEVTDKDKEYDIRAELPGVKKEDLDIDVEKNYITIRKKITNSSKNQNSNMVNLLDLFIFLKKLILKKQKLNLNMEF